MSNEEIVEAIQDGEDVKGNLSALWEQNRAFVAQMARKYQGMSELDDLMQEGFLTLYEAALHYDPDQDVSFLSYAGLGIQRAMRRYGQRDSASRLSFGMNEKTWKYRRFIADYRTEHGCEPSDDEIMWFLGVNEPGLEQIRRAAAQERPVSLDSTLKEDEDFTVGDMIPGAQDVEGEVLGRIEAEQLKAVLWSLVDSLEESQAAAVKGWYQEGKTWQQVGENLGVSPYSARTSAEAGLKELKKPSKRRLLLPFVEDYISTRAFKGNGVGTFNRTFTSSTERVALGLIEEEERQA